MKVNDLRIGNIINDTSGEDLPITELIKKGTFWNVKVKSYSMQVDLDDCSPVELTEEWLLKFGFRKISNNFFKLNYIHNDLFVYKCGDSFDVSLEDDRGFNCLTNIQYVHQLQNLYFALTGNELELKL